MHHIENHLQRIVVHRWLAGIEPEEFSKLTDQRRLRFRNMVRRRRGFRGGMQRAKRVKPRMQFESPFMRFVHCKRQRIIVWLRCLTHFSGQILRPRFDLRIVERVAVGPHLKYHRVELQRCRFFQHGHQFRLLSLSRKSRLARPVEVSDGRYPDPAKLTKRRGRYHRGGNKREGGTRYLAGESGADKQDDSRDPQSSCSQRQSDARFVESPRTQHKDFPESD